METKKFNSLNLVAGGLWIAYAIYILSQIVLYFEFSTLVLFASTILFAIGNFTKQKSILLAGSGAMILNSVISFFTYIFQIIVYSIPITYMFKTLSFCVLDVIAIVIIAFCIFKSSNKLWLVSICIFVCELISLGYFSFLNILFYALKISAFTITMLYWTQKNKENASNPAKEASNMNGTYGQNPNFTTQNAPKNPAYISTTSHVLLLLFTCGIWILIWIYKFTGFTNTNNSQKTRSSTNELLLCMFIPFYQIYWMYKTAERVDEMAYRSGVASNLATICLVLEFFVPFVPPILLQNKMNEIVSNLASNQQNYQQPQYQPNQNYQPAQPQYQPQQNYQPMQPQYQPQQNYQPAQPQYQPQQSQQPQNTGNKSATDIANEIDKYRKLRDSNIITEEDFEAKKNQILGL